MCTILLSIDNATSKWTKTLGTWCLHLVLNLKTKYSQVQYLKPVILATQEVEIKEDCGSKQAKAKSS
jgi:hypothetical protein